MWGITVWCVGLSTVVAVVIYAFLRIGHQADEDTAREAMRKHLADLGEL